METAATSPVDPASPEGEATSVVPGPAATSSTPPSAPPAPASASAPVVPEPASRAGEGAARDDTIAAPSLRDPVREAGPTPTATITVAEAPGSGENALMEFPTEADVRAQSAAARTAAYRGRPGPRNAFWFSVPLSLLVIVLGAVGYWQLRGRLPGTGPATPSTGTLAIESTPAGAAVLVDGQPHGRTPVSLSLPAGPHDVSVAGEKGSRHLRVQLAAGAQVVHHLELGEAPPAAGQLHIVTGTPGAAVTLDGVRRGATPIDLADLAPGEHTVTVADALNTVTQRVTVPAGGVASLVVPLGSVPTAGGGWLTIASPIELQVFEGESLLGTSRSDRIMMLAGQHRLRLANAALEFETTRAVGIEAGRVRSLRIPVPDGRLSVNAVPWAEVLLDGRAVGETPIANLSVPIGSHEVVLRHPRYGEHRRTVVVAVNAPARLGVDLRQ